MAKSEDLIAIRVRPRSSRSGLEKGSDGGIVVRVHAAAREGAANRECQVVLAKALGVSKSSVRIIRGEKGRGKQIAVAGLSAAEARALLDKAAEEKSS